MERRVDPTPASDRLGENLMCETRHHLSTGISCTRPDDHLGLHRTGQGAYWFSPPRRGRCLAIEEGSKMTCILERDHWEAHRLQDGAQFTGNGLIAKNAAFRSALAQKQELRELDAIDAAWPVHCPTIWERL